MNQVAVRLAHVHGAQGTHTLCGAFDSPTIRLAVTTAMTSSADDARTTRYPMAIENPAPLKPALLISYFYLKNWIKYQSRYIYRDWVMDSGAFSAHASGNAIDLLAYIEKCKELLANDPTLTEVFALDVIGDWRASMKNLEQMWKAGVPAIPAYHVGEPTDVLMTLARDYPKIALGGCVGFRGRDAFAAQCFARVWPKKIHGFGFNGEKSIMALPWHSCDSTSWEIGPCAFGRWNTFGGKALSVRGSKQNLRGEVEFYLSLERRARSKWKKQMAELDAIDESPTVRLALSGGSMNPLGKDNIRYQAFSLEKPKNENSSDL